MSYQVIARKWRPKNFEEIVGQKHIVSTLKNAIASGRIAHAYLFSGPRGIGKTTTARILAKALNCQNGPTPEPCNVCPHCDGITSGSSIDVLEIDGASNRGIDEIRSLRETVGYAPVASRYKVYIIDEVHMLTQEAFNALLKTLEEPPRHVIFVFATTEPQKLPLTILSRCQRFDFRRIPTAEIVERLKYICDEEGIHADEKALFLISRRSEGALRDAESLLDQAASFEGSAITAETIEEMLGLADQDLFLNLTEAIAKKDIAASFEILGKVIDGGIDVEELSYGLAEHFRNLLFAKIPGGLELLDASEEEKRGLEKQVGLFSEEDILRMLKIVADLEFSLPKSIYPRLRLELAVGRLTKLESSVEIGELLDRLSALDRTFEGSKSQATKSVKESKSEGFGVRQPKQVESTEFSTSTSVPDQGKESSRLSELPLSFEAMKENWKDIVAAIRKERPQLGAFIAEGSPTELVGQTLKLAFGRKNGFHIKQINNKKEDVEKIIETILGKRLKIECLIESKDQTDQVDGQNIKAKDSLIQGIFEKEPGIKSVVELFDGEVTGFED